MHVYHYAAYEQTALKRLTGRHGTRETELDELLRGERFVDLYAVVRQGLRISKPSYSIKKLEEFYWGHTRTAADDGRGRRDVQRRGVRAVPGRRRRRRSWTSIADYNREDVRSTHDLHAWLEERRAELEQQHGSPVPRPAAKDGAASETQSDAEVAEAELADRLKDAGHPLLAGVVGWHRREERPKWWDIYRLQGPRRRGAPGRRRGARRAVRADRRRRRQAVQAVALRVPAAGHQGQRGQAQAAGRRHPGGGRRGPRDGRRRRVAGAQGRAQPARADPARSGRAQAAGGQGAAGVDRPRRGAGARRRVPARAAACSSAGCRPGCRPCRGSSRSTRWSGPGSPSTVRCSPSRGRPASGKTTKGAAMIRALLDAGLRVGVTAQSHAVVSHLLEAVGRPALQKCDQDDFRDGRRRAARRDQRRGRRGARVPVGDARRRHGLALGPRGPARVGRRAGRRRGGPVLPRQRGRRLPGGPLAGAARRPPAADPADPGHPPRRRRRLGPGAPARTVTTPSRRTAASSSTRRSGCTPRITAFVSTASYDGRLASAAGRERQHVSAPGALSGHGLRWVPVAHDGNTSASPQEAAVVAALVEDLCRGTWTDAEGVERRLGLDDVLVVAPYNEHVACLRDALPEGARVGTVDKFQGQQAPVVIYSMASSSAADAPRGVDFLYDLHRLNVGGLPGQGDRRHRRQPRAARRRGAPPRAAARRQRAVPVRRAGRTFVCAAVRQYARMLPPSRSR